MTEQDLAAQLSQPQWLIVDLGLEIEDPGLVALKAYWDRKRGERVMPGRADIDPLDLPALLGRLFLVDVVDRPARFRYRLIGSAIVEAVGRDSTGNFVEEIHVGGGDALVAFYRHIVEHRVPARNFGTLEWVQKEYRRYEAVVLPLGAGEVVMLLGGMAFASPS